MSKINLTSKEWNDLIFEGRNKKYGAYDMRQDSNKRHIIALLVILALALLVFYLPALIKTIIPQKEEEIKMTEVTELSNLPPAEEKTDEVKQEEILLPPPPPLKSSLKFTAPVIKKDAEVAQEDEMKTQEEVTKSDLNVSIKDVQGTDEEHGKDISEIKDALTETNPEPVVEKTYTAVEQMPSYPGGDAELMKYLRASIRYPRIAEENRIEGTVVVSFVVTKTGKIEDVKVLKSLERNCDNEAVRVVAGMKDWLPGKQNGASVRVQCVLPIKFTL